MTRDQLGGLLSWVLAAAIPLGIGCGSSHEAHPPPAAAPTPPVATASPAPETPLPAPTASAAPTAEAAPRPTPMSGELPRDLDAKLTASAVCAQTSCPLPGLVPAEAAIDPAAPAAVWSHDLAAAGSAIELPAHAAIDLYAVVVKGSVSIRGEGAPADPAKAWTAIHVPGAGVSLAAAEAPARVVLAAIAHEGPVSGALAPLAKKGDAARVRWKKRPGAIEVVDLAAARDLAWGGGAMHARIAFEGAGQKASLGMLMASKDAPVPQHQHDDAWEILAVLRGHGTARRADAPGAELAAFAVSDGAVVAVPKATQHAWTPAGDVPLVAVQLYVPPGPEQRFKKLAESEPKP